MSIPLQPRCLVFQPIVVAIIIIFAHPRPKLIVRMLLRVSNPRDETCRRPADGAVFKQANLTHSSLLLGL